jgi:uncharacterized membrane protein YeiH
MTAVLQGRSRSLLTVVDLTATFVFAMEGAIAATYYDVDLFGVMVLGFSTALVGGIVRDVLIGCTPPASLRSPTYPVVALAGAGLVLLLDRAVDDIPMALFRVTDALGLSLFAVAGAMKALDYGIRSLVAALLGAVSACGGGVVRDMMLNIVPVVLRTEIYALAALAGATTTVLAVRFGRAGRAAAMTAGFLVCLVVRLVSVWQGWSLPHLD